MVFGWKFIRRWLNTLPALGLFPTELVPGPAYVTDAQLANFTLQNTQDGSHWGATAKFGNETDTTRVCDPHLRVVGIKNLRISDSSVYPAVDSHMQASAAMAGERVAHFILTE